ncbi:MAG TPA: CDP-alcohol phosphatidyltransferase family protein [Polyangiaceae bacterium]
MSTDLAHWLFGRLSGSERVWSAIAPALFLLAYFAVAAVAYGVRRSLKGPFHDEEMEHRGQGGLTTAGLRHFFAWTMRPFWTVLARVRFPPNAITSLSFAIAFGAGVGVAAGRFALGGWLFIVAGALDFLDGRVARSTGRTSPTGAALDSILDRYVESALIVGLAWYYRDSWVLVACLLALTGSLLVPYVRARGESLGVRMADVGFMQRPERVLLLGIGTAMSPIVEVVLAPDVPHPPHRLAIVALVVLAITSHATALQRLHGLVRLLGGTTETGIGRPVRAAVSNGVATLVDFMIAAGLVYLMAGHPSLSTAVGCIAGAAVSFVLSRVWAFSAGGAWAPQITRYIVVSAATAGLNAGGVALLSTLGLPFVVAWCIARGVLFATWSYPLQRDFVFVKDDADHPHISEPAVHSEPAVATRP